MGEGRSIWIAELKGLARVVQVGCSSRRWGRLLELVAEPRWSDAELSTSWLVGKLAAWGRKRRRVLTRRESQPRTHRITSCSAELACACAQLCHEAPPGHDSRLMKRWNAILCCRHSTVIFTPMRGGSACDETKCFAGRWVGLDPAQEWMEVTGIRRASVGITGNGCDVGWSWRLCNG